jgi:leucyl aminopeptidase
MQVSLESHPLEKCTCDLLALPFFELDPKRWRLPARLASLDRSLGGRLAGVIATGDFRGKRGDSLVVYPDAGSRLRRVLLVGLGAERDASAEALRAAAGTTVSQASARRAGSAALVVPALRRLRLAAEAQALAEGAILGSYRFDRYKTKGKEERTPLASLVLLAEPGADVRAARAALRVGKIVAESQNLARELSNQPPNALPPAELARAAQRTAREAGLRCRVFDVPQLRRMKAGGILAVGGGSSHPPRMIVLEHEAPGRGSRRPTVCIVGKGITFDSGGLSIKPAASMVSMKHDMSGAAAVIGCLRAAALLRLPLHVVGVIASAENMPSDTAYRPDDILTTMSGQTVEIGNTDAEGRIVLSDALWYAHREFEPQAIVDVATLTGACSVALGKWASAVLGTNERLIEALRRAGEATHERLWPLPLWPEHRESMRSEIADVKQTGGRDGGTITAAAFLSYFVGDSPWAHLDIAPTANVERAGPYQSVGATGVGVRLLVEFLRNWRASRIA